MVMEVVTAMVVMAGSIMVMDATLLHYLRGAEHPPLLLMKRLCVQPARGGRSAKAIRHSGVQ